MGFKLGDSVRIKTGCHAGKIANVKYCNKSTVCVKIPGVSGNVAYTILEVEPAPAPQFQVGDRVRIRDDFPWSNGRGVEGLIENDDGTEHLQYYIGGWCCSTEHLTLIECIEPAATVVVTGAAEASATAAYVAAAFERFGRAVEELGNLDPCHACPGPFCGACEHCTDRPGYEPARYDLGLVARTWDHVGVGFNGRWESERSNAVRGDIRRTMIARDRDLAEMRRGAAILDADDADPPTPPMLRDWRHGHWGL